MKMSEPSYSLPVPVDVTTQRDPHPHHRYHRNHRNHRNHHRLRSSSLRVGRLFAAHRRSPCVIGRLPSSILADQIHTIRCDASGYIHAYRRRRRRSSVIPLLSPPCCAPFPLETGVGTTTDGRIDSPLIFGERRRRGRRRKIGTTRAARCFHTCLLTTLPSSSETCTAPLLPGFPAPPPASARSSS